MTNQITTTDQTPKYRNGHRVRISTKEAERLMQKGDQMTRAERKQLDEWAFNDDQPIPRKSRQELMFDLALCEKSLGRLRGQDITDNEERGKEIVKRLNALDNEQLVTTYPQLPEGN